MYVHDQSVSIGLAGYVCDFLLRQVHDALMPVKIYRINESRTTLNSAVHEQLNPVRFYLRGSEFFGGYSFLQNCIHIHPTVYLVAEAQYEI